MLIKTSLNIMTTLTHVNNNVKAVLNILKEIKNSVDTLKLLIYIK